MNAPARTAQLYLFVGSLVCCLVFCTTAALGVTKNDILQPLKDDLKLYGNALKELNRQVKIQFSNLDAEQKRVEKNSLDLDANIQRAQEENEALREADNVAVLAGWQLITELDDILYLPGYGRITMKDLLAAREKHREELDALEAAITAGKKEFFIAELGMVDKSSLEKRIADIDTKKSELEKEVADGSVGIYFPDLGFVTKGELEGAIALQKAKIEEISKQIDAGDYRVSLPGLGDVSRNQLKSRIASLQERITALQRNFKSGDVRINRFSKGWLTANGLKESEQLLKDKSAELKENIKKKEYKHLLPIGWVTPKDLDARISQLQEEIENIKTQLANKQYKIALADGSWATEKDIDKALMNSLLSVDVKAALARGKKSILVVSQYEIAKRELELAKLKNWKAELKSHILPLSDFYSQQLKQYAALKKEFSVEQTAAIAPLKLRLSFMQRSLRQLP